MKTLYKISIIIFLALTIYIVRGDIQLAYNNISSYFLKDSNSVKKEVIKLAEKEKVQLEKKVDMPGALRVVGDYINGNSNIKLSKDNIINITNTNRQENGNLEPLKENLKLDVTSLREFLKKQLPIYMVPSFFIELDSLPITPNGKLDRQALCTKTLLPIESFAKKLISN